VGLQEAPLDNASLSHGVNPQGKLTGQAIIILKIKNSKYDPPNKFEGLNNPTINCGAKYGFPPSRE